MKGVQNKLYEQYGRGIFNTKTKKIVKFVPVQVLKEGYDYDPTLFALSIDPLAGKFPHISPYAFCDNSPIVFVDKGGKEKMHYLVFLPADKTELSLQDKKYLSYLKDIIHSKYNKAIANNGCYLLKSNLLKTDGDLNQLVGNDETTLNLYLGASHWLIGIDKFYVDKEICRLSNQVGFWKGIVSDNEMENNIKQCQIKYNRKNLSKAELGLNGITSNTVAIYPNPTNHVLNIDLKDWAEHSRVEIYNTFGSLIHGFEMKNKTQLDISSFSNGMYIIKIVNAESGKIFKQSFIKN